MEKLYIATLSFPALVAIMLYQYKDELLLLVKSKIIGEDVSSELFIVIPSARDHFVQRQTIRDTWWQQVTKNKSLSERIKLKFLLGSSDCPFPPEERLDEYSCEPWMPDKVAMADQYGARITQNAYRIRKKYDRIYGLQYVAFKVDHPVLLSKLGVHEHSIVPGATVTLLDAVTQKEIVKARFSHHSDGESKHGFVYKSVETYLLPKGFEGVIQGDNPASSKGRLPSSESLEHYAELVNSSLVHFLQYEGPLEEHYEDVQRWKAITTPLVSFVYTVNNADSLSTLIESSPGRQTEWNSKIQNIKSRIETEQSQHGDLLIVDSIDTYRNITRKLLQAFVWLAEREDFQFLLKTDDDCYVNLTRILEQLTELRQEGHKKRIWWGRFRHNWLVEAHGKWSERQYTAPVYPQFACGAGYVLSQDIVSWLTSNADQLHMYQGEDVSMGIWLSAVHPHYIDDPLWQCESQCISDMYAVPDLNQQQTRQLWDNSVHCGDPCGCG